MISVNMKSVTILVRKLARHYACGTLGPSDLLISVNMKSVTILVQKLARRYACGTLGPSDLLKKREKIGEYVGRNFCTFIHILPHFIHIN